MADIDAYAVMPPMPARCAFDRLEVNGEDIRREPIEDRKRRAGGLLRLLHDGMALNRHLGKGAMIYEHACALGCEGIVSKRLGSPRQGGRPHLPRKHFAAALTLQGRGTD
jgi:ATP-dependent DNA ligase